ncbi:MAG: class I SAM-dependent methyltransferase [Anaerolineaceae bacterium]|nr:class I SAM-dependent methyltransferase [Anaerolineaceae bacterium]
MQSNSIERIIPEQAISDDITGQSSLKLHIERYEFALKHLRPGRLLDIACGVGYGTLLLVEKSNKTTIAIGVDLSRDAISYANTHYAHEKIIFREHDAMTFSDEEGFDSIVSLETLEHVTDPFILISQLENLLHPGGVIIASVPTTPSMDVIPYHLHDFTEHSYRKMMTIHGLKEIYCLRQIQSFKPDQILKREESRMKDLRTDLLKYYFKKPMALVKRLWSTIRYGFTNRYLTVVWQKDLS